MIPKGFIPSSGTKSFAIMGGSLECVNDVIRVMDEVVPVGAFPAGNLGPSPTLSPSPDRSVSPSPAGSGWAPSGHSRRTGLVHASGEPEPGSFGGREAGFREDQVDAD